MSGPGTSYPHQEKQQAPHGLTLLFCTEVSPILLLLRQAWEASLLHARPSTIGWEGSDACAFHPAICAFSSLCSTVSVHATHFSVSLIF